VISSLAIPSVAGAAARVEAVATISDSLVTPPERRGHVAPPPILTERDVAKYRRIFALQRDGKWLESAKLVATLDDDILLGHVQAQKFLHPTKYRSRYPELLKWLRANGDHPQASRLYKLALARKIAGWKSPPTPKGKMLLGNGPTPVSAGPRPYRSARKRSTETKRVVTRTRSQIRRLIRKGWPTGALKKLTAPNTRTLLDNVEFAFARAEIAHGFFVFGKDARALELAEKSIADAVVTIPVAAWTAGLAAWRLGQIDRAGAHFEALAAWLEAGPAARAAGAYWASRTHLASRRPREATKWLAQAATVPGTFYGLLARRALGVDMPLDWNLPRLTRETVDQLLEFSGMRRGFALLQLDMKAKAAREFRRLFWTLPDQLRPAVMTIAARHGLPSLAMRSAGILNAEGHRSYYAALFPVPNWTLPEKLEIDPSLLYAIVRQESHFDPDAKSGRGARGLMQLMPRTAAFVGEDRSLRGRVGRKALFDPTVNIALGGRYVRHLMDGTGVGTDLFKMLAAYNAGPGTLRKWEREVNYKDDPLFFIESIPSRETRNFIENVLRNLWMYRLRRAEPAPSLDRVAAGSWPRYESVDGQVARGYSNARN
jgi:soluble lytic murein transglycosylase